MGSLIWLTEKTGRGGTDGVGEGVIWEGDTWQDIRKGWMTWRKVIGGDLYREFL